MTGQVDIANADVESILYDEKSMQSDLVINSIIAIGVVSTEEMTEIWRGT